MSSKELLEPRQKVSIKVIDETRNAHTLPKWTHVCYINSKIYKAFFDTFQIEKADLADFLSKWVKEDWNLMMDFTKSNDIRVLRELVIDKYKQLYPFMYFNYVTDTHGWVRVWVSEKMGKEIKLHDKDKYKELFGATKNYSGRL